MKKIRIVSDGTFLGTAVYGPSGQVLPGVVAIQWIIQPGNDLAQAYIQLEDIEVEIEQEVTENGSSS